MRQIIDDEPEIEPEPEKETIHVWMVREKPQKPFIWRNLVDRAMACLAMFMMAGFVFTPGSLIYHIVSVSVSAILLPAQTIQASTKIVPTGIQQIQARQARGWLSITNGSSIVATIPAGFIVESANEEQIATDAPVTVAASNGVSFGRATVQAHAVLAGAAGNIAAYSIDQVEGTSLYIKNPAAFSGGRDTSTRRYITTQDKNNAIAAARSQVEQQQLTASHPGKLLVGCTESTQVETSAATVSWLCQYATFNVPAGVQVLSAQMSGQRVMLRVQEVVLSQ